MHRSHEHDHLGSQLHPGLVSQVADSDGYNAQATSPGDAAAKFDARDPQTWQDDAGAPLAVSSGDGNSNGTTPGGGGGEESDPPYPYFDENGLPRAPEGSEENKTIKIEDEISADPPPSHSWSAAACDLRLKRAPDTDTTRAISRSYLKVRTENGAQPTVTPVTLTIPAGQEVSESVTLMAKAPVGSGKSIEERLLPVEFKTYPDTEAGPDKAHKKNLKTRQDETAKHGVGWEKVVCKIWDSSPGKVNLIDYLDGGPGNHSTYENVVKWRVNGTEQTSQELSLGPRPDPDKHTHFYVQVMPKNGGDTLDRLIITVVPPATKTNFDNWYTAESTAAGKAWFAECPRMPSSLEVTPLQSPDRLFSPRIWRDPEAINTYFHPNGYYEIRAKKTPGDHGHQVTFSDTGALILTGVSAGTADKEAAAPEQWYSYHVDADVTPFMWALQLDGNPCDQDWTTLTMPMLHEGAFIKKYMECRPPEPNAKPRFAPGGTP